MNQTINNILANVEGRYLSKSEQQQIREWAEGFDARAKAATEVESKERDIVEGAMGQVMNRSPISKRSTKTRTARAAKTSA